MPKNRSTPLVAVTVAVIVAVAALLATVGADANWLAALGHTIAKRHSIPAGVPFAAAPTGHWTNAIVLAELAFAALHGLLGERGLMLAQLAAVAISTGLLARDARDGGAQPPGICAALLLAGLGALTSLAIVRVQLFSLALFPLLVALLRAQARRPSSRIWLVVPLLALWSNLHGVAILGLLITLGYLACSRLRAEPTVAVAVGAASTVALCLTPALTNTPSYYYNLLTNAAAAGGHGMWGPLSLTAPLDLVLIATAGLLLVRVRRARPELWEWAVLLALTGLTIKASRNGVWLLLFIAPLAARAIRPARTWRALVPAAATAAAVCIVFSIGRGPSAEGAGPALITRALALAHGSPILADDRIAEQVALAGGRVWVGNPIDAFSMPDQLAYLGWTEGTPGGRRALTPAVRVVLVSRGGAAQRLMAGAARFTAIGGDATAQLFERRLS